MAQMDVENKVWQLPINVTENGEVVKVLATADTYVDKNIEIKVSTPDASFEVKEKGEGANGEISAVVSNKDTTYTSDTETPYAIEIAANAHVNPVTVGVKDAGFAAATDEVTVAASDADENTKTIYVKEGHLTGSGEATATSSSIKMTKGGTSDFKFTAVASGGARVDVAGWLPVDAAADSSGNAEYAIQAATLANTATATSYEEHTGPVLTSGGYLYINEGYIKDTKISLADLVPDDANITDANANLVYNTIKAYDADGALIVGTMGDATLSEITASDVKASIGTVSVAAQDGVFHVTGSGDISGDSSVAIATRGLAETTLSQTGTIEGEAELDATLAKIGLSVDVASADLEVTPVIAKEDATTAKSGAITTSAPAGGRYIAVSTAAIAAFTNVTPTVATEGYGTADLHDATGASVKAGAAASGTYYIPVEAGSHSAVAGETSIVNASATVATATAATAGFEGNLVAGILTTAPAGEYITISADATPVKGSVSGTVTCTSVEGYIENGSETASIAGDVEVEVTAAAPKYIRVYDGTIL